MPFAIPAPRSAMVLLTTLVLGAWTGASAQTISYSGVPLDIGSGLQSGLLRAQLSDSQHGGITVRIESADTTLAFIANAEQNPGVPFVDVFVPNGSVNANFWVQTLEDTTGTVVITASAPGFASAIDSVDILPAALRLNSLNGSVDVNGPDDNFLVQTGLPNVSNTSLQAVQAARAGGPGLTATITNSNAAAGQLVTTALTGQVVTAVVLPGQSTTGPNVALGGVAFDGTAAGVTDITASIPGFIATSADTQTVTVVASTMTYSGLPFDVGRGLQDGLNRVQLSAGEHGGVTVHIEPGDTTLVLLSPAFATPGQGFLDIFLPNGQTQADFYIHGLEDTTGSTSITASAPGFPSVVDTVHVVTPAHRITSLASNISIFAPEDVFVVQIGLPKPDNSTLKTPQPPRAGGPGVAVTFSSSDSTVAVLVTNTDTSGVVTAGIAPGSNTTPGSVGAGGVALDGIGLGTSLITASIPTFVPTIAGSLNVTVTQPGITFSGIPTVGVGAGLQSGVARAVLGASAHGGTTVTIKTTDPGIALVSQYPDSVGRDSVEVDVPDLQVAAEFYIHGVEDTSGTVTLTASATNFSPGNGQVDIVQPAVRFIPSSLGSTIDTIDPPDEFRVQVGAPFSTVLLGQKVRAGSPGVLATATVDDSTVATFVTLTDTSQTNTVLVPAGASSSPLTVAAGGIAFDGLAAGTVTASLSAPGFGTVTESQKVVTVTAPFLNIPFFQSIGAGLQSNAVTVTLSASNHGGVLVHLESQDTLVALVASGETDPGTPGADVFVSDGQASAVFYIQGVDDATGTSDIVVSAPQFDPDTASVTVVQPAVAITSLASTIGVGQSDEFRVKVGIPDLGNTVVQIAQKRRGGAPSLVVGITSADTTAARLNTLSQSGDSVTVLVDPGESMSPSTVAAGGVSLEAVAAGQTVVFASIPGFIQTGGAQQTVDVENVTITYLGLPAALGAGLETNLVTAQLGNGGHGGVNVHIAVDDTTNAKVSANALVLGNGSVDIPVPGTQTDAPFYIQSVGPAPDTIRLTASAPGFTTQVDSVEIVPAGLRIDLLPDTLSVAAADTEFVVQIGAIRADSSGILERQLLRPGIAAVPVTVTSSDTTVGILTTLFTMGDSAALTMNTGEGQTPLTVAGGGVAFDPRTMGFSVVHSTAPGFVTTGAGSLTVMVVAVTGIPDEAGVSLLRLEQSTPNPFTRSTTIRFTLSETAHTRLTVFDVRGRRVVTLLDRVLPAGPAEVGWYGRDHRGRMMSPGIYFYRLEAGGEVRTMKMVLLSGSRSR